MSEDPREAILRAGGASLYPWHNVARGTFGYAVLRMEFDGLLRSERVKTGPLPDEHLTRYTLTDEGRAAAKMMID